MSGLAAVGVGLLGNRLVAVTESFGFVVVVVGFEFDVAVVFGLELDVEAGVDLVLVALDDEDAWACTARRETPAIAARAMEL